MVEEGIFIGIGSNLGNRLENIQKAIQNLTTSDKIRIQDCSSVYETEPWRDEKQPRFLNSVLKITTTLSPLELLKFLESVERRGGRKFKGERKAREIDLDLLLYNQVISTSSRVTLPQRQLELRYFALKPLLEIEPNSVHPITGVPFSRYSENCKSSGFEFYCGKEKILKFVNKS